ncbi:MAG: TIM barrel protein [Anaerolineae bacterium]|nr:TIM barrel protein [Anaerolineae bacterium]
MNTLKQSVSWWCFVPNLMSPEALVRTAAEIGYAAVELVDQPYWQIVKDHGLSMASMRGHASLTNGLNRRENRAQITDELTQSIALAATWGIPNVICFSGNRNGQANQLGAEITAESLQTVAKIAENAGVTLALELLNSKVDHPDYQCDHTAWGVQVCEMVNSPAVKLLYDIYHMQVMEGDVISTIQQHHRHFAHYHTAGVPGRHEIDAKQELNYTAIVRAIAQTGYDGYIGQEFVPMGDPVAGLKAAFEVCTVEKPTTLLM